MEETLNRILITINSKNHASKKETYTNVLNCFTEHPAKFLGEKIFTYVSYVLIVLMLNPHFPIVGPFYVTLFPPILPLFFSIFIFQSF